MKAIILNFIFLTAITCTIYSQSTSLDLQIQEIKAKLANGQSVTGETIHLNAILFETGNDELTSQSRQILNQVIELLNLFENRANIEIAGFTDDIGNVAMNLELSKKRANAVKAYLIRNSALQISQISSTYTQILSNLVQSGRSKSILIK